jgi:hypothetical protein
VDGFAAHAAAKLKIESGRDTDIALIAAEDLVWVAAQWLSRGNGHAFNLEVFNITGILDRKTLEGDAVVPVEGTCRHSSSPRSIRATFSMGTSTATGGGP